MDHDGNKDILLDVVYQVATFGNFLRWFIDKYSKHTPHIDKDPFTSIGTAHNVEHISFSDRVRCFKPQELIKKGKSRPFCLVVPNRWKHFLYLSGAVWYRGNDLKNSPDFLYKKAIGEMPEEMKSSIESIIKLYSITNLNHFSWIQKFIVRDWYKIDFLQDLNKNYYFKSTEELLNDTFINDQNIFKLDMESFFNWQIFLINIKQLDLHFKLGLDMERIDEMRSDFMKGYDLDHIRKECNFVVDVLENRSNESLTELSVISEAFIYAHFEKSNPDIQMPLTNRFFRDMEEIRQYIEHFPNWYRRRNPNLL